jgi:hypothetical protein
MPPRCANYRDARSSPFLLSEPPSLPCLIMVRIWLALVKGRDLNAQLIASPDIRFDRGQSGPCEWSCDKVLPDFSYTILSVAGSKNVFLRYSG